MTDEQDMGDGRAIPVAAQYFLDHVRIRWPLRFLLAWRMLTLPNIACATIITIADEKVRARALKARQDTSQGGPHE